jgi:uncharacterized protein (DUF1778 family)
MAMNLRLTAEQDRALVALAEAQGISKQEAAVRAIVREATRLTQDQQVREYARGTIEEYRQLLERLADS